MSSSAGRCAASRPVQECGHAQEAPVARSNLVGAADVTEVPRGEQARRPLGRRRLRNLHAARHAQRRVCVILPPRQGRGAASESERARVQPWDPRSQVLPPCRRIADRPGGRAGRWGGGLRVGALQRRVWDPHVRMLLTRVGGWGVGGGPCLSLVVSPPVVLRLRRVAEACRAVSSRGGRYRA